MAPGSAVAEELYLDPAADPDSAPILTQPSLRATHAPPLEFFGQPVRGAPEPARPDLESTEYKTL